MYNEHIVRTKKKSIWKMIIRVIAVLVALVFVIGAGATLVYESFNSGSRGFGDRQNLIKEVDEFIRDINDGKMEDAYAHVDSKSILLSDFRSQYEAGRKALDGYMEQDEDFQSLNFISISAGRLQVSYETKVYFWNRTSGTILVTAVQDGPRWKIVNLKVNVTKLDPE